MSYLYNSEHKNKLKTRTLSHSSAVHIFGSDLFWKSLIQILQKCTNGLLLDYKNIPPFTHYSKHPHIRTLILEVRLIRFLYIGCLVKNQPEGVLKLFLKIGGGNWMSFALLYCFAFLTRTKHMNATYFQHNSVSLTTAAARTWCLQYCSTCQIILFCQHWGVLRIAQYCVAPYKSLDHLKRKSSK